MMNEALIYRLSRGLDLNIILRKFSLSYLWTIWEVSVFMGLPKLTICFEIANTHVGIISKVIKHFESKCTLTGLQIRKNSEYKI